MNGVLTILGTTTAACVVISLFILKDVCNFLDKKHAYDPEDSKARRSKGGHRAEYIDNIPDEARARPIITPQ